MKIFLLFYAVSIILCWIGIRTLYKAEEWDVEPFCIILMFMPVFNFIDSIINLAMFLNDTEKAKEIANKFFKVK